MIIEWAQNVPFNALKTSLYRHEWPLGAWTITITINVDKMMTTNVFMRNVDIFM